MVWTYNASWFGNFGYVAHCMVKPWSFEGLNSNSNTSAALLKGLHDLVSTIPQPSSASAGSRPHPPRRAAGCPTQRRKEIQWSHLLEATARWPSSPAQHDTWHEGTEVAWGSKKHQTSPNIIKPKSCPSGLSPPATVLGFLKRFPTRFSAQTRPPRSQADCRYPLLCAPVPGSEWSHDAWSSPTF